MGRRLLLKPYGDELLTRGADFWIFSARLIILAMALAEALAWGYMGALMSREHPWITAAIAGLFVFTLIWIIDTSFMTLDLARGYYERELFGKSESPWVERLKVTGGVAARVAIVSASLFITAPFLAQAIFAGDVRDEMAGRNAMSVAAARQQVTRPYLARAAELRQEQKVLEDQRVKEAAGVGPSGRYGRGPALETIERQLVEKRGEILAVERARLVALARFDRLSPGELEKAYGIRFLAPGIRSSATLLDDMMKNPQFAGAELAVRAFLAFLFIGLLILKLFQPRSVGIYFSERMHSIHDEYRKGLFDDYLPVAERASAGATIDALRFEEWCLGTYASMRKEDARRRETAREQRVHEMLVEQWRQLGTSTRAELDPLVARRDALLASIEQIEEETHRTGMAAAAANEERAKVEATRASMRAHIERGGMDGATFERAITAERELDEKARAIAVSLRETEGAAASCARRMEARRRQVAVVESEIAAKQAVIADAERRIADERMKLAELVARQREAWNGADGVKPAAVVPASSEA
jgi:hypothetical protein